MSKLTKCHCGTGHCQCKKEIERLRHAIHHIHWSMGDELLNLEQVKEVVCSLCDKALANSEVAK